MTARALALAAMAIAMPLAASSWLVITGSYNSVTAAIRAPRSPNATIVSSDDCQNLRPGLYLSVAAAGPSRESAESASQKARAAGGQGYVRECNPKPGSRIALGVPLIDPSIETVPADAVNWTDKDRVSEVVKLPVAGYLWLRRRYDAAPEDPREGRRVSVLFFPATPEHTTLLDADCTDASFAQNDGLVALSCAREMANGNLLHETKVYREASGKQLIAVSRCRTPEFLSPSVLQCQSEKLDRKGELSLIPKQVVFTLQRQ